jgi:hypothetical protein
LSSYGEHPHDAVEEWAALTEPKLNIEGNSILAFLSLDAFLFGIKSFILISNDSVRIRILPLTPVY